MNVAYFLTPKNNVAFLYEDFTLRQALEKLKFHGYTAIPVISREGKYLGTVREGDFLWHLIQWEQPKEALHTIDIKDMETLTLRDLARTSIYEPVNITATVEQLIDKAITQNFVPVVDDLGSFIGIITRRDIIKYFYNRSNIE